MNVNPLLFEVYKINNIQVITNQIETFANHWSYSSIIS